jgi:hypothetical protein
MILLCIAAFLVGVALCRFFRVLILAPALIAILVVVAVRSAYVGHGLLHSGFEFALLSISLQFGLLTSFWLRFAAYCNVSKVAACMPRLRHLHQKR